MLKQQAHRLPAGDRTKHHACTVRLYSKYLFHHVLAYYASITEYFILIDLHKIESLHK